MVGGKRVKFGVEIYIWGVDPNPCAGRVGYFHIRVNVRDGHGQRGASVDDGVFAEEDDLARGRGVRHARVGRIGNPTYER